MEIRKENNSVTLVRDKEQMEFTYVKEDIIRCRYTSGEWAESDSMIIEDRGDREEISAGIKESSDGIIIYGGAVKAAVSAQSFETMWMRASDDGILLAEGKKEFIQVPVMKYTTGGEMPVIDRVKTVDGERNFIRNLKEVEDHKAWQGRLHFRFTEDEHIHGLGQAEEGIYDYRGHVQYLYQHNMRIPMPVMVSDKGYGILFDCTSLISTTTL